MPWVLAMDWVETLFLHWRVDAASMRDRIPRAIEIDTFDGDAWASIVAFRIAGARPRGAPRPLAYPTFPEVNVRTYVRCGGRSGVWFFSLDAQSRFAVALGRHAAFLPYVDADIAPAFDGATLSYDLARASRDMPAARFAARARFGGDARPATPGSLDDWLVQRLAFFTVARHRVLRLDVAHAPWPLYATAIAQVEHDSLLSAAAIRTLDAEPLAHVSPGVAVRAWPLRSAEAVARMPT